MKINNLKQQDHKDCALQYLGRDYSFGIVKRGYFCITHQHLFTVIIPIKKGSSYEKDKSS